MGFFYVWSFCQNTQPFSTATSRMVERLMEPWSHIYRVLNPVYALLCASVTQTLKVQRHHHMHSTEESSFPRLLLGNWNNDLVGSLGIYSSSSNKSPIPPSSIMRFYMKKHRCQHRWAKTPKATNVCNHTVKPSLATTDGTWDWFWGPCRNQWDSEVSSTYLK